MRCYIILLFFCECGVWDGMFNNYFDIGGIVLFLVCVVYCFVFLAVVVVVFLFVLGVVESFGLVYEWYLVLLVIVVLVLIIVLGWGVKILDGSWWLLVVGILGFVLMVLGVFYMFSELVESVLMLVGVSVVVIVYVLNYN